MKLYDLKKGDRFTIDDNNVEQVITFDHLDGMYSVCFLGGKIVHVAGFTDVTKVEDKKDKE